jgi:hypothetical protein
MKGQSWSLTHASATSTTAQVCLAFLLCGMAVNTNPMEEWLFLTAAATHNPVRMANCLFALCQVFLSERRCPWWGPHNTCPDPSVHMYPCVCSLGKVAARPCALVRHTRLVCHAFVVQAGGGPSTQPASPTVVWLTSSCCSP